ncbi:COG0344 Predicted membrane protein [Burkholderiales bacterium]|jgi:glycerol-3-phosphate acyltransferase PlsY
MLMSFEPLLALYALIAYLIGSISFAIVVSRLRGIADPRSYGSHNPGATNVLRSGDKIAAALTLFGDAAKGFLVVLMAGVIAPRVLPEPLIPAAVALCGVAVFLGHLYPIYFRFQGGKGVATAFGVLLGFMPAIGLLTGLVWLVVARVGRISSLAALSAAGAAPVVTLFLKGLDLTFWATLSIAVLLVIRHKKNIAQLLSGQEQAFRDRPQP